MAVPVPFECHIADEAVDALRTRLALTRFPDAPPGSTWEYGASLGTMQRIKEYWQHEFDWRAQEARLNSYEQASVAIDGIGVHYLKVQGKRAIGAPEPMPLLLVHGWPGSVFEFLDIIDRLTDPARFGGDPADAFTVIAPSLPGFTFSFAPHQPRCGVEEMASMLTRLMTEQLGYERFGAQGGDWGSFVVSRMASESPELFTGIHLNMMPLRRDKSWLQNPTPEQRRYADELDVFLREETGYQWIQGTRPQTLAFALNDSPLGLAAWMTEKFQRWTDCNEVPDTAISIDTMLANISLYWFTECIGSSFWPYYARHHRAWPIDLTHPIEVPTGYCEFPREILRPPRSLAEQVYPDIRRWSVMPAGGHFAAMEQPEALASEVQQFFHDLRHMDQLDDLSVPVLDELKRA
tara:strand:+ start:354 stop:1574 length:1221 start_codon:yes stop_codon:yes gene_type:complete